MGTLRLGCGGQRCSPPHIVSKQPPSCYVGTYGVKSKAFSDFYESAEKFFLYLESNYLEFQSSLHSIWLSPCSPLKPSFAQPFVEALLVPLCGGKRLNYTQGFHYGLFHRSLPFPVPWFVSATPTLDAVPLGTMPGRVYAVGKQFPSSTVSLSVAEVTCVQL